MVNIIISISAFEMILQHYTARLKSSPVWLYEKGMKMGFAPEMGLR